MSATDINGFDYRGLDDPSKHGLFLGNVLHLESKLREIYIERLQKFNRESLEQNPEPFRFLKKENCSVLIFILPFDYNQSTAARFYLLSTPNNRKEQILVVREELADLDSFIFEDDYFNKKLLPLHEYHESQIIFSDSDFFDSITLNSNITIFENNFNVEQYIKNHNFIYKAFQSIKSEINGFQSLNQTPLSYYAKDVYKFPFSLLDLKPLVELVDDNDFSYQLDQAMAAYHDNLFLPCAATLGVVLETLCIKILEGKGVKKVKAGDTQLGKLIERLSSEQITSRRNSARLEVAYKMRNMASHSSPGIALKEDCHFMLNVINTIAFEYLGDD